MDLSAQVVIVTGAAGGLGLEYARRFAKEGCAVVLTDVKEPGAEVTEITASNSKVLFLKADVRSWDDAQRLSKAAISNFGRIDTLINNAALFTTLERKSFEEITAQEWEQVMAVNVQGAFNCIKAVVPAMKEQGRGKIINIASNVVHKGLPFLLHYVASKGAIVAMTRALARELGPYGITVNAVAPGYVLHEGAIETDRGRNDEVIRLRALRRTQTPDDLLGTMLFLASRDSDFITGQTIVVDGGEVFV